MQPDAIAKEIRRLTVAVWVLVLVSIVPTVMSFLAFRSFQVVPQGVSSEITEISDLESWEGLTIEEKLARSTVVIVTTHVPEGDKIKAVVAELLKHDPGVKWFYSVGQEVPTLSHLAKKDTKYGEGSLVLFHGSPAQMKQAYSIYDGRLAGLGDMPVADIRTLLEGPP